MLHVALSAHTLYHTHTRTHRERHTLCIDLKKPYCRGDAVCEGGGVNRPPLRLVGVSACQHKWVREIDELVWREKGTP